MAIVTAIPDDRTPGYYRPVITDSRGPVAISVPFQTPGEAIAFGEEVLSIEAEMGATDHSPTEETCQFGTTGGLPHANSTAR